MTRARGLERRAPRMALASAVVALLIWAAAGDVWAEQPVQELSRLSEAFVQIAQQVTPSIVSVTTKKVVRGMGRSFPEGTPFEEFFRFPEFFKRFHEGFSRQSLGSGVVVSKDGYILTNNHVIEDADEITVGFTDKREFTAKVVGTDPRTDLAVVKIQANGLVPVPLGDSDALRVGEWVVAIGNPFGFAHTVTAGIVSAKGRSRVINPDNYEDFIQTDAAINPGNSGGALVNIKGQLVGVNTAIATRTGGYQGIGFAIPINMAQRVMADLIAHGEVVRGWLGVMIQDISEDMARALKLPGRQGTLVSQVLEDGPAAQAGIKEGDVIVEIDGNAVESTDDLRNRVAATAPGKRANLAILRDGKRQTLTLTVGQLPAQYGGGRAPKLAAGRLGLDVQELTPALGEEFKYQGKDGVLVSSVEPGSPAAEAGLREGDIIREINRETVKDIETYQRVIRAAKPDDTLLLLVRRTSGQLYLTLRVPKEE